MHTYIYMYILWLYKCFSSNYPGLTCSAHCGHAYTGISVLKFWEKLIRANSRTPKEVSVKKRRSNRKWHEIDHKTNQNHPYIPLHQDMAFSSSVLSGQVTKPWLRLLKELLAGSALRKKLGKNVGSWASKLARNQSHCWESFSLQMCIYMYILFTYIIYYT